MRDERMARAANTADSQLVGRCLAGDPHAWRELVERYDTDVQKVIGHLLHHVPSTTADDLTQQFWCDLFASGCRKLAAYDPGRGSLDAYLAVLAGQAAKYYRRNKNRKKIHEFLFADVRPPEPEVSPDLCGVMAEEFASRLTPSLAQFLNIELLGRPSPDDLHYYSPANRWQLQHRLLVEFHAFFHDGERRGG
jgi:DNA-directed RNA polymerase specialized sigma24 family protein